MECWWQAECILLLCLLRKWPNRHAAEPACCCSLCTVSGFGEERGLQAVLDT